MHVAVHRPGSVVFATASAVGALGVAGWPMAFVPGTLLLQQYGAHWLTWPKWRRAEGWRAVVELRLLFQ